MQNGGSKLALIACKFYANDLLKFQTKFLLDVFLELIQKFLTVYE